MACSDVHVASSLCIIARGALLCFSAYVVSPLRMAARLVLAQFCGHDDRWFLDASPVLPCSEEGVGGYVATVRSM